MNVKRLTVKISGMAVFGTIIILLMWSIVSCRRCISIGDMDWIYLGGNISEIRFKGNVLVGPCQMEIEETGDVVYGNSDEDSPWFVIDKKTHCIVKGDSLNDIYRAMGMVHRAWILRLETFLTRWNAMHGK